jgi:hypothetical protein
MTSLTYHSHTHHAEHCAKLLEPLASLLVAKSRPSWKVLQEKALERGRTGGSINLEWPFNGYVCLKVYFVSGRGRFSAWGFKVARLGSLLTIPLCITSLFV